MPLSFKILNSGNSSCRKIVKNTHNAGCRFAPEQHLKDFNRTLTHFSVTDCVGSFCLHHLVIYPNDTVKALLSPWGLDTSEVAY